MGWTLLNLKIKENKASKLLTGIEALFLTVCTICLSQGKPIF